MIIRRLITTETVTERREERAPALESPSAPPIPTVSEFTRRVAGMLEAEFGDITVQGEISGWNRASSGHTYFTLKDEGAVLGAVLWRSRTLEHQIRDGMKVVARGRITLYPPRGQYQLDCTSLVPLGLGDLQIALERLKAKLLAEGLFDPTRKKRLPEFPRKIGVVTSRTGAAVRDIITTLSRRMPLLQVVLRPALVQGAGSAEDIALAIKQLNEFDDIDLLIVGRGGGSIEDLWAFNEEVVARAIAASRIPIISAVGHEIDFTIADFVADLRAATPTAAAEIAVRDRDELLPMLADLEAAMGSYLHDKLDRGRRDLQALLRSRGLARPVLARELRRRGVDSAVVDRATSQLDSNQEEATARALVERKLRATAGLDQGKRIRRLASMLARKGYAEGLALRVVRQALEDEGEEPEILERYLPE